MADVLPYVQANLIALADVSANDIVADVIALSHDIAIFIIILYLMADVIATRKMFYPF